MNICAIDCSSVSCSVCILQDGKVLSSVYQNTGLTHSQTLLVNIRFALQQAGMTVADMDQIAVTTGPGSFTGIKIGLPRPKVWLLPKTSSVWAFLPCRRPQPQDCWTNRTSRVRQTSRQTAVQALKRSKNNYKTDA